MAAVKRLASEGKLILFVTTKPQAKDIVKAAAMDCGMPYLVERWLGGMLTNFTEIKKMIKKYVDTKNMVGTPEFEKYTKKEQLDMTKNLEKVGVYMEGLVTVDKMPDVLFVPSLQRETTAVEEANRMKVTVVGVADSNANPEKASYFIPGNDDAINAIKMLVNLVAEAVKEGRKELEKNKLAQANLAVKK